MAASMTAVKPTNGERLFARAIVALLGLGIGPAHMRILEVRGRKSGTIHTLPVDLLDYEGKVYLVAPRGQTQWARNVEAAGELVLRRGRKREQFRVRALANSEKAPILKAYLERFQREVARFFPIAAGSPVATFDLLAPRYPSFELRKIT